MTNVRAIALAGLMCLIVSAQARADVTGFIGVNTTPANRQVSGVGVGTSVYPIRATVRMKRGSRESSARTCRNSEIHRDRASSETTRPPQTSALNSSRVTTSPT